MANEKPDAEGVGEQSEAGFTVVEQQQDPRRAALLAKLVALPNDKRTVDHVVRTPEQIIAAVQDLTDLLNRLDLAPGYKVEGFNEVGQFWIEFSKPVVFSGFPPTVQERIRFLAECSAPSAYRDTTFLDEHPPMSSWTVDMEFPQATSTGLTSVGGTSLVSDWSGVF